MKSLTLCSIFLLFLATVFTQENLVQNPGFEFGDNKGYGVIKVKNKTISKWHAPLKNFPTLYITPKKSVAVAFNGRNAVGLVLGSSRQEKTKFEYITGSLSAPLEKDAIYCIQFNTILQRSSRWAATDVGVLLHNDRKLVSEISDPTSLSASLYANEGEAMVNTKWNQYSGYYIASGGEKYISFGKFGTRDSKQMKDLGLDPYFEMDGFQSKAYYQIDDFSVKKVTDSTDCGCAVKPVIEDEENPVVKKQIQPYLFALDASGSMKRDGLFDSLRHNLVRFLKKLPNGTPVSFVTFASSSRKIFAGEIEDGTAEKVDSLLDRAPIGGGTNVFVGLQLAYESWDTPGPDSAKMVLISDGEFHVSPKIAAIIKNNYESEGRKLTLIQIGARTSGLEQVKPYMDDYIHTTQSELNQVVAQLQRPKGSAEGGTAVNCECIEEYSDTMNYHFVIDFSGSMKDEKSRATSALRYLFNRAPDNAMMTITTFNTQAEKIYVGKKSDITMAQLTFLLAKEFTGGGTDPTPGVKKALNLAQSMSEDRFSHIILITDLSSNSLSRRIEMGKSVQNSSEQFDLAAHAITVASDGVSMSHAQFDITTRIYQNVSRMKFEKDLFYTKRSSCDYTSESYHYNPAKAAFKNGSKKVGGAILKSVLEGTIGL